MQHPSSSGVSARLLLVLGASALMAGAVASPAAGNGVRRGVSQPAPITKKLDRSKLTLRSAIAVDLNRDFARLPLYRARIGGRTAWYVITDVSDADLARRGD